MKRHPTVLDLLEAVRLVSPRHGAVRTWWLTPKARLQARGQEGEIPVIDLVVQCFESREPHLSEIERELTSLLGGAVVRVRAHRGERESQQLMRLFTVGAPPAAATPGPRANGLVPQPPFRPLGNSP